MHRLKVELGNIDTNDLTPEVAKRLATLKDSVECSLKTFEAAKRQIRRKGPKAFVAMEKDGCNDYCRSILYSLGLVEDVEQRLKEVSVKDLINEMLEEGIKKCGFPSEKFIFNLAS